MATYLLTWNPKNFPWSSLEAEAAQTRAGTEFSGRWSCGRTKKIRAGDRVFLLKQGHEEPRGIIAAGLVTSPRPFALPHWNSELARQGKVSQRVVVRFDRILNPYVPEEPPLPTSLLLEEVHPTLWNTQASGVEIKGRAAQDLEALWRRHLMQLQDRGAGKKKADGYVEEDEESFPEGRLLYRLHRVRERSASLVSRAKERTKRREGRLVCQACGFDFERVYGVLGADFIECHHTVPVSELRSGQVTRLDDLALVCSNCHRMLHRRRPWLTLGQLSSLLAR